MEAQLTPVKSVGAGAAEPSSASPTGASQAGAAAPLAPAWSRWWVAFGILLVLATMGVTYDAWADTLSIAIKDEESSYILLGPVVVVWILYARRGQLRGLKPAGTVLGPALMAFGWFCFSYGYRHRNWSLWHAGPVVLLLGAVLSVVDWRTVLRVWPAVLALLFLTPISPFHRQRAAFPLQTATAYLTQASCDLVGIYVDRFQNVISLNGTDIQVAEACNGMRMMITLLVVFYVVVFTAPMRPWVRLVILALSPAIAVACNVVRLVPTVWMYGNTSKDVASAFHDMSGWVMIVVAFFVLKGIVGMFESLGLVEVQGRRATEA